MPLSLLSTSVASASPSMSSAMMSSGSFFLEIVSSSGIRSLAFDDLLLVDEDVRVLELDGDRFLVGDEVRRQVAAVELHALDDDDFGLGGLAFLDGDDAVGCADLLHGLGELLADLRSLLAAMVATSVISFWSLASIFSAMLLQLLDDRVDALLDAAGQGHRVARRRRWP